MYILWLQSRTAVAKVVKFAVHVSYINWNDWDDILPPDRCSQFHVIRFLIVRPHHLFGAGESRHFKFGMLIDKEKYDRSLSKGMCLRSRDSLRFGK